MTIEHFDQRRLKVKRLVRSSRFLRASARSLASVEGIRPCLVSLDDALRMMIDYPTAGRRSSLGEEMSFSDDKSLLLAECKRALYEAADSALWRDRVYDALHEIRPHVSDRVESEGGEEGIAGEVACDMQMILLHALFGDAAVADIPGAADYLALVFRAYEAGALPIGWDGVFPASGTLLVRCAE